YSPLTEDSLKPYSYSDDKGRFRLIEIVAAGIQKYEGRKEFEFEGVKAPWLYTKDRLKEMLDSGLLYKTSTGSIKKKQYLKDVKGLVVSDIWVDSDVKPLQGSSAESLGYQTQKPVSLLERIIKASSKEGDWVLDPFCGCGTTVSAAEKLKRNWIGIDITALSINLIKHRLMDEFKLDVKDINVDGFPKDLTGAGELFKKDPFQFEHWAVDLINARPAGNKSEGKMKGADKGIDGVMYFIKNTKEEYGKALVQVKGGGVKRSDIATLKGDVDREKAEAGIFITLEKPTKPMIQEAVEAGTFSTPLTLKTSKPEYPKIQILTIEEILNGKMPDLPQGLSKAYYKEASASKVDKSLKQKLMI
ncbi:MAG TPA: site-specific DNA-methyltransferase, partial [Candidatus Uhrbacteria bacterium]|nr:site-specific DNA-methyltransferase [Candidatus Uhrbacteria bacterium]